MRSLPRQSLWQRLARHRPTRNRPTRGATSSRILAVLAASLLIAGLTQGPSAGTPDDEMPFRDPALPLDQRIDDLLGRLTLEEKVSLLHQSQAAIPRLDIPYFKAGTEALHGVAWSNDRDNNWGQVLATEATVFPQAVGLASTWNAGLIEQVGSVVGTELRGYNAIDPVVWGTQVWSPVVDLLRDPRWGRNEEGYSEDPLLTGAMATAYGSGLSGDDPQYLKVAPVLKHFYGYNNEVSRNTTSSNLRPRVKHEYSQAPFRTAIEADAVTGIMASYNMVNGRPTHVDPDLNEAVRTWTDKTLYNISDAWGPHALTQAQFYFDAEDEAYAAMLKAGLDEFTVDENNTGAMIATIESALDKGYLTEADIDGAVRNALTIRMRLGQFDPDGGPYGDITADVLNQPAHQDLNRETATEAMVLLDNSAGALPLDPETSDEVAVIGPLHDTLFSDWYGGRMPYEVTPLDGITERLGADAVTGVEGLDRIALKDVSTGGYLTATGTDRETDFVVASDTSPTAASQWDVNEWTGDVATLRNAGNGKYLASEFGPLVTADDEPSGWFVMQQFRLEEQDDGTYLLGFEGYATQENWFQNNDYVTVAADGAVGTGPKADAAHFEIDVLNSGIDSAVSAASDAEAAVVVVGSQPFIYGRENHDRETMALGTSQQELVEAVTAANPNTVVVLETSYPVTMDEYPESLLWTTHAGSETGHAVADVVFGDVNPAGRLTQTWYTGTDDLPSILDYDIVKTGMTYMYYEGTPLYPFGHGLSYTDFEYSKMKTNGRSVGGNGLIRVSVDVTNVGNLAGDEVVQLYTHQRESRDAVPNQQLAAFERVSLEPGETKTVRFRLRPSDLAHWDVTREKWVVERSTYDLLVGSSSGDAQAQAKLRVRGERIPPRDLSEVTRAENFDDYSGGVDLVDESKQRGTSVGSDGTSGWISFADAKLRWHDRTFTARVANGSDAAGTIEVRRGTADGPLLGSIAVEPTGDVYTYTDVSTELSGIKRGRHDVYLVFDGELRLAEFSID